MFETNITSWFGTARSQERHSITARTAILLFASTTLLGSIAIMSVPQKAFADNAIELKSDVPKMDMPLEAPRQTLKGTVQHSFKNQPPQRKPLNGGAGASNSPLSSGGSGRLDRKKPSARASAATQQNALNAQLASGVGIIGVKFIMNIGQPPVINLVFPGTPAAEEGIRPHDIIVAVDGVPTYGLSKEEVYDLIVGTPHTPVTLSLQRGGDFTVKRIQRMDFNDITDPQVKRDYLMNM